MKFYDGVWGGKKNNWLNFGGNPDHNLVLVETCALLMLCQVSDLS